MEFSVMDAIKTASETITDLQKTFGQIREKANLYNATNCTTEEINRLTDIEKRLDKVEKTNTRNGGKLQSTLKMVKILSQKVERLSSTTVIPKEKLGTKTHDINKSQTIEKEHIDNTSMRIPIDCDDPERHRVQNLALKKNNIYKSNESGIVSSKDETDDQLQKLENKTDETKSRSKQVNRETDLMQNNPENNATTEIRQKPRKIRSESGHKLCLTAANEDNRCSYHKNKDYFHGELLQPVVQRDNKPNFLQPNIVVTKDKGRSTTNNNIGATGKRKRIMTMAEMIERDFDHEKNVHSMREWAVIASQSQVEVGLKMMLSLDKISRRGHDYLMLMDISESMRGEKFNLMTKVAIEYIDGLQTTSLQFNGRDNIGLACFGGETKLIMHPIADYDEIKAEIGKLKPGGPSPLAAGLLMALSGLTHYEPTTFGHYDFPPCIIVMTDGVPTRVEALREDESADPFVLSSLGTMARDTEIKFAVKLLSRRGIKIYWIPFGSANTDYAASDIANEFETTTDVDKGRVKTAIVTAGIQEYDVFDDITDNVMLLLDPVAQYHGRFRQPRSKAIPLGTRVRRGPSWHWENQDTNMAGTVIGEDNDGKIYVEWDNGYRNRYVYDENTQNNDIKVVNEPRRLVDDLIAVGCKVKRGKDWRFGDQDGGTGSRGTVLRVEQNGKIVVNWDRGRLGLYKFAGDSVFEVEVCDHRQTLISSDLILPPTEDMNPSTPLTSSSVVAETPLILPSHKSKNITSTWQYQNVDGQWTSYDEETNAKIDMAFNRNSNGKCIIEINNIIYIVKFTIMIQENQKVQTVVPVQRLEEEDDH